MNGWLILHKPPGISSAKAVFMVKKTIQPQKIGHGGTLDPLASGVLPLALGEATKVCGFMLNTHKAYEFTLTWGEKRDTDDAEGCVLATSTKRPSEKDILACLLSFKGHTTQTPPLYSAIKIQGKRACDRARAGECLSLKERAIVIHDLVLKEFDKNQATFYVKCSKGTYVRALARDMAEFLGTYGYIAALKRIEAGKFHINEAISIEELAKYHEKGLLRKYIRPIHSVLDDIPAVVVNGDTRRRLELGQRIVHDDHRQGLVALFDENNHFFGLAEWDQHLIRPRRLMVY